MSEVFDGKKAGLFEQSIRESVLAEFGQFIGGCRVPGEIYPPASIVIANTYLFIIYKLIRRRSAFHNKMVVLNK